MFYHSLERQMRRFSARMTQLRIVALFMCLLVCGPAQSLPDDRDQPIRITADTAIRDEKQGFTVYTGNVHMIQGSLDIVADKITIYHETAEADKIVAEGRPAKMKQLPALDEPMIRARAQIIEYYKLEDRVNLKIDAHITRDDGSSVTGDSIDYYIADELIKADSDQSPDGKPVVVVIPPTVVREEDEPPLVLEEDEPPLVLEEDEPPLAREEEEPPPVLEEEQPPLPEDIQQEDSADGPAQSN